MHDHDHDHMHHNSADGAKGWKDWSPLLIVVAFIVTSTIITLKLTSYTFMNAMSFFMGFFFLYFSLFKLLDIKGFALGYQEYDIVSKRIPAWSYVVPFVEFMLGVTYLLLIDNAFIHITTLIFSVIVIIGVIDKLSKKNSVHCACLGTVLKVPLSWVSALEYIVMAFMALTMIAY